MAAKPVRLIVPFRPAASPDSIARITTDWLAARLGQPSSPTTSPGERRDRRGIRRALGARRLHLFMAARRSLHRPHVQSAYDSVRIRPYRCRRERLRLGVNDRLPPKSLAEFRGDRAARAGLLSAMTGCPSRAASQSVVMRAMLSVTPPAETARSAAPAFAAIAAPGWVAKRTAMKISARTGSV